MEAAPDNPESTDQHTDSNPTPTTDEPILTPMETTSNSAEAGSGGSRQSTARESRKALASKPARKTSQHGHGTIVNVSVDSDGSADTASAVEITEDDEDLSSASDTDGKGDKVVSSKTASKKAKKSSKGKAQAKAKASKKRRAKKSKKAPPPGTETESDSSESDTSDEDSEDDSDATQTGVKQQLQTILQHINRLEQRVNQPQGYPHPAAPGYPPIPGLGYGGVGYPYGVPPASLGQPSSGAPRARASQSTKGLDTSRNQGRGGFLEKLLAPSLDPLNDFMYGWPGVRGRGAEEDDTDLKNSKKSKKRVEFKRVDSIWDTKLHNFKLQDTVENVEKSGYDRYIFHVRRTFDFDNKYRSTFVDIKSKLLRECLQDVIGNVKGISLVDETPKIYPNQLFLYLEDFREHLKFLKEAQPAGDTEEEIKKNRTRLESKQKHLKLLVKYLDTDFAKIKDSLTPMLENGIITFDLLWALWKPHTLAYATTYGSSSEPRVFKVNMAQQHDSILSGKYYSIDGKYFEHDGKKFGFGSLMEEISEFQGARKITSLRCYPLKYHKNEQQLRADLIERGKKFVSLSGMHYKAYQGIAFQKRKKNIPIKFHIQPSRVMVDSATFRRINPNYSISAVKAKDHDVLSEDSFSDDSDECCGHGSDDSDNGGKVKFVRKFYRNTTGGVCMARVPKDMLERQDPEEKLSGLTAKKDSESSENADEDAGTNGKVSAGKSLPLFTDEEYLMASPVVLGFSFSEKQWLELAVSGVKDIKWNDKAWDSLVLETDTKDLVKALVESRTYHAASTIDDVIQGKGKGLVTVLHGPPGTGKTLTAEGISELLKCPLYMVSAGELGTDSRFLEMELQKILDICHTWGAILLLDEADVFLEKRDMHNIHRNALVSVFLRQLEYFQGILFLTTNRVETFDEAFQSRIHIALRYENLDAKAKRKIFEMFLGRVQALGKIEVKPLTDDDLHLLSKQDLNGREIKNVVGSAQDLAVNKGEALSIRHIRQVLNVHAKFGRDLKGGTGYEDAMRSYF